MYCLNYDIKHNDSLKPHLEWKMRCMKSIWQMSFWHLHNIQITRSRCRIKASFIETMVIATNPPVSNSVIFKFKFPRYYSIPPFAADLSLMWTLCVLRGIWSVTWTFARGAFHSTNIKRGIAFLWESFRFKSKYGPFQLSGLITQWQYGQWKPGRASSNISKYWCSHQSDGSKRHPTWKHETRRGSLFGPATFLFKSPSMLIRVSNLLLISFDHLV